MSVSMINGHIDPDKSRITPQEALAWVEDYEKAIKEEQAIVNNGDEFHVEALKVCEVVKQALEKQMPKKPYKRKEHKQNDYYCTVCKRYLGDDMELKHACLQPEYCQHCGQALDWSDTE